MDRFEREFQVSLGAVDNAVNSGPQKLSLMVPLRSVAGGVRSPGDSEGSRVEQKISSFVRGW